MSVRPLIWVIPSCRTGLMINGGKSRQHDKVATPYCVDLIICDTPDIGLIPEVVDEDGDMFLPEWNMVKKSTFCAIFHMANALLANSGFLLLFVLAKEQSTLMSGPWAVD